MTSPFLRSIRRTLGAAAGIASLLGPAVAHALPKCVDYDGDGKKICVEQGDAPDVHGTPVVDTSSGTYRAPPSLPPSEPKDRDSKDSKKAEPPAPKTPDRKFVRDH